MPRKHIPYTERIGEERKAILFELYSTPMDINEITQRVNAAPPIDFTMTVKQVRWWARKFNLQRTARIIDPEMAEKIKIITHRPKGTWTWKSIALELNLSVNTVKSYAYKIDYTIPNQWASPKDPPPIQDDKGRLVILTPEIAEWETIKYWAMSNNIPVTRKKQEDVIKAVNERRVACGLPGFELKVRATEYRRAA